MLRRSSYQHLGVPGGPGGPQHPVFPIVTSLDTSTPAQVLLSMFMRASNCPQCLPDVAQQLSKPAALRPGVTHVVMHSITSVQSHNTSRTCLILSPQNVHFQVWITTRQFRTCLMTDRPADESIRTRTLIGSPIHVRSSCT